MYQIENIRREHILEAIARVDREGVPPRRNYKSVALEFKGKLYPTKLLVSWANNLVNGEEIDTRNSSFTTEVAIKYLKILGFTIIYLEEK